VAGRRDPDAGAGTARRVPGSPEDAREDRRLQGRGGQGQPSEERRAGHNRRPAAAVDSAALARIIGHAGEQTGLVFEITIGRPDTNLREHGALINARMGLNTWAAFGGSDADGMVAGDVAMLDQR
jgi:hypothetical protein